MSESLWRRADVGKASASAWRNPAVAREGLTPSSNGCCAASRRGSAIRGWMIMGLTACTALMTVSWWQQPTSGESAHSSQPSSVVCAITQEGFDWTLSELKQIEAPHSIHGKGVILEWDNREGAITDVRPKEHTRTSRIRFPTDDEWTSVGGVATAFYLSGLHSRTIVRIEAPSQGSDARVMVCAQLKGVMGANDTVLAVVPLPDGAVVAIGSPDVIQESKDQFTCGISRICRFATGTPDPLWVCRVPADPVAREMLPTCREAARTLSWICKSGETIVACTGPVGRIMTLDIQSGVQTAALTRPWTLERFYVGPSVYAFGIKRCWDRREPGALLRDAPEGWVDIEEASEADRDTQAPPLGCIVAGPIADEQGRLFAGVGRTGSGEGAAWTPASSQWQLLQCDPRTRPVAILSLPLRPLFIVAESTLLENVVEVCLEKSAVLTVRPIGQVGKFDMFRRHDYLPHIVSMRQIDDVGQHPSQDDLHWANATGVFGSPDCGMVFCSNYGVSPARKPNAIEWELERLRDDLSGHDRMTFSAGLTDAITRPRENAVHDEGGVWARSKPPVTVMSVWSAGNRLSMIIEAGGHLYRALFNRSGK